MRNLIVPILLLAVAEPAIAAEGGQPCSIERVASVDLLIGPRTNAIFVNATINGTPKYFIVDTGGIHNSMTFEVTRELSLPTNIANYFQQNMAGQTSYMAATVDKFGLGTFPPGRMQFMVDPPGDLTLRMGPLVAGTLAPGMLRNYDVEFDLAAAKMNLFKPSTCIQGPYWEHAAGAAIDLEVADSGHIFFPMTLDGKVVRSALDTGMSVTMLKTEVAKEVFGIDPLASGLPTVGSITGDSRGRIHSITMHTLATAGSEITVNNPRLHLVPDLMRGTRIETDPQLIVGLSMLKQLHIYIAYHLKKLFVTPASGPPAVTLNLPQQPMALPGNPLRADPGETGDSGKGGRTE